MSSIFLCFLTFLGIFAKAQPFMRNDVKHPTDVSAFLPCVGGVVGTFRMFRRSFCLNYLLYLGRTV